MPLSATVVGQLLSTSIDLMLCHKISLRSGPVQTPSMSFLRLASCRSGSDFLGVAKTGVFSGWHGCVILPKNEANMNTQHGAVKQYFVGCLKVRPVYKKNDLYVWPLSSNCLTKSCSQNLQGNVVTLSLVPSSQRIGTSQVRALRF